MVQSSVRSASSLPRRGQTDHRVLILAGSTLRIRALASLRAREGRSLVSSECKYCFREINFVMSTKGKMMPLDVEPRADGNLIIEDDVARYIRPDDPPELTKYVSHFATCSAFKDKLRW